MSIAITIKEYKRKNEVLNNYYNEIKSLDFYKNIFTPDTIESPKHDYEPGKGKPNPIICVKAHKYDDAGLPVIVEYKETGIKYHDYYIKRYIMLNDYSVLKYTNNHEFAVCGLHTCWGKNNSSNHAFTLYGYAVDIDGVGIKELERLIGKIENDILPRPTYIVNSGGGVHFYYIFEVPMPLYPWYRKSLDSIKRGLTSLLWRSDTTNYKKEEYQYQGIFQNFRMVGSNTKFVEKDKNEDCIVKAFSVGDKVDLTYINRYILEDDESKKYGIKNLNRDYSALIEKRIPLEEAKEKWPEWWEKKQKQEVLYPNKNKYKNKRVINRRVYDWWLQQIKTNDLVSEGRRYYIISFLFVFAVKCEVPYDEALNDAISLIPLMNSKSKKGPNNFVIDDVIAASEMYDEKWIHMSWKYIKEKSGLTNIKESTKRNHRKRADHLKYMRDIKAEKIKNGTCHSGPISPVKDIIWKWMDDNPGKKATECSRQLNIPKRTVYKWFKEKK